jgi:hypothetical protein
MSKHVHNWLQAYYDGELHGRQLARIEAHLSECQWCQEELDKLKALGKLLQDSPPAQTTIRPEQFVAQVGMRLPRRSDRPVWQRVLQTGWTFAPLALFLALAFSRTAIWIANLMTEVELTGVGGTPVQGLLAGLQSSVGGWQLPFALPEFGLSELLELISGFFGLSGSFGIDWTLSLVLPAVIGLLSLSWVAGWWVTQNGKS